MTEEEIKKIKEEADNELGAMEDHLDKAMDLVNKLEIAGVKIPDNLVRMSKLLEDDDYWAWRDWLSPLEVCQFCGDEGTEVRPLRKYVISAPVDGDKFEETMAHDECAAKAARDRHR